MIVNEAISNMRIRLTDTEKLEYTDGELVNYLNDAINIIWLQLAASMNPEVIKKITISTANQSKPADFYKFTAKHPVITVGDTFEVYGSTPIEAFYITKAPKISSPSETKVLFNDLYDSAIIQIACLYALNTNEFDISQDSALASEARKLIM